MVAWLGDAPHVKFGGQQSQVLARAEQVHGESCTIRRILNQTQNGRWQGRCIKLGISIDDSLDRRSTGKYYVTYDSRGYRINCRTGLRGGSSALRQLAIEAAQREPADAGWRYA